MANKKKKKIVYTLDDTIIYANGGPFDKRHGMQEFADNPKHYQNESGENIFYDQSGGINDDNFRANDRLNYQDYQNHLRFIESHGMGVDEFYNTYPDQDTYNREFPQFDAQMYALGGRLLYNNGKRRYAAGGNWNLGTLNSNPYAPIGQVANMAGTMGAGILDNAIPDQHQRINVGKETSMGMLKGAGQGAALGANPMLAAATGGLSIAAGAVIGGAAGGLISHKNAKKNAQANHDALIEQYYGNNPTTFEDGGQMNNNPNQFGNQMSVFQGNKHEEGGIQLGMNSEVEAGEVKWKDYIFSDQLTPEGSKETFARKAKRIKNKFKGRENDVKANEVLESELSKLAAQNDMEIEKKTTELNKFRNGGRLKYANGGNPWEFQQFEDSPINVNSLGNFRGSTANYGIGDFNYVDDRLYTETPGANDYPVFKNSGNYPIKPKTGSYSSVDYANDEVFPHNISQGRTLSEPSRDRSKDYLNQLGINDPTQPSYIPSFDPFEGSDQTYDFNDVTLPSPIKSKFEPTVKRSDQLPQRELGFTQSTQEDLSKYDDFLDKEALKDRSRFGYAEAGLLASNMAGVDNLIKSMKPAQTKFDRVKLDRLDLSTARDLNARNSALGQRISQANVRNNATSSGQALSTLAASNGALTNQRINADLSTMLQEEQANNQITNQERSVNNQISREEYIANEQNRSLAQSTGNFALSSIGNNFQGYAKDKVLTKNDIMGNKRMMEVLNQMSQNYQWNVDPESDQLMIKYISKLANQ